MAVYRPSYRDLRTGKLKRSATWWFNFNFAGRHIQESSKSPRKTVAVEAEKNRRRELENAYNGIADTRSDRIRSVQDIADAYLKAYKLRHRAPIFAKYAVGHVARLIGRKLKSDIDDSVVIEYQNTRLEEKAAPKTINEEVGFLLRMLEDQGDALRAKMKRRKTLKLACPPSPGRAFTPDEKAAMLAEAQRRKGSPSIYPALVLALHCGLRDKEARTLRWSDIDLLNGIVTAKHWTKTEAGTGRTIPMNADVLAALKQHSRWFLEKFGEVRPEWFIFPGGRPRPNDPTRHCTSFKTVWTSIREACSIEGRWHDNRHTWETDLLEDPNASDHTILSMAGQVSQQMLKHYNHTRMEAKRRAVDALVKARPSKAKTARMGFSADYTKDSTKVTRLN